MKASELLQRYAAGERNFRGANLRGQSFKGKDLSGADFSEADVRGANFTNATLKNAKFIGAKAGIQKRWLIGQLLISFLISALVNFASMFLNAVFVIYFFFNPEEIKQYTIFPGLFLLLAIGITFFVIARQGLTSKAVKTIAFAVVIAAVAGTAVAGVGASAGTLTVAFIGAFVAVTGAASAGAAGTSAFAGVGAGAGNFAGAVVGVVGAFAVVIAADAASAGAFASVGADAGAIVMLNAYVGWRTSKGDEKFTLARSSGLALCALGGTSFRGADLTDVNFENAILKSTNFNRTRQKQTVMTQVLWRDAKSLDRARVDDTYLQNQKICKLLITLQGQEQNFDRLNLSGINLKGASLQGASFISADLNSATLQDADLSRAKLKQTQLDGTDFTGAILTGAYIEDWGITGETKLNDVQCEYVYMHVPTIEDPDPIRKPDNKKEIFEDRDFADFIKPIVDTLDLYHNEGIDPRAIAIALKSVAEKNPDAELEWVAMEKRGPNNLLLRFRTSEFSDKSKLSAEYFDDYNQLKALPSNELALLAANQGNYIRKLTSMIETSLQQPKLNIENLQNQGDFMVEPTSNNINIGGDVTGSTINLGKISGNVSNALNQLPSSSEPNQPGIKERLTELQKAIEEEAELQPGDKADLLEQVKALAVAAQTLEPDKKESLVRQAKKMFKATLEPLSDTAKLAEACNKLLPIILGLLGFASQVK
jgi:uncharacterized protein YjbI with pentapeptide repeats